VFLPDGSDRDHYAVNVSGPNAENISDLDFPDTIVIVGGFDPLQDWQRRYYEWLKRSGKEATLIEYRKMFHAFYIFPELPESSRLFSEIKEFVTKRLSKP
jgi:acetyl esterase/lipase